MLFLRVVPVLDRFFVILAQIIGHHPVHFGFDQVAVAVIHIAGPFKSRREQFFHPDAVDIHEGARGVGEGEDTLNKHSVLCSPYIKVNGAVKIRPHHYHYLIISKTHISIDHFHKTF